MQTETFKILELISKTPGRLDKEKILKDNISNEELKFLFETSFNPYLVYGVKDFKVKLSYLRLSPILEELVLLRNRLSNGDISGNIASDIISHTLSCVDSLACKWLEAAFKKDIRCGVDVKTINKIWPDLIPTFEVGLCQTFEGDKLPEGNWFVEPKMDGLRGVCFIDDKGEIEFLSRTGKPIYNLDHIKEEIKQLNLKNVVLDGEIMGRDWNESVGIARSEKNTEGKDIKQLKYYIFDYISRKDWESQSAKFNYVVRKGSLARVFSDSWLLNFKYLVHVFGTPIFNLEEAKDKYGDYLKQGFEGVVLKEANSAYPFKRSKNWLKWKPFYSEDLPIVGWEEGKGRNKGRLGKFFVDYKGVEVGVGGGYSDPLRIEFFKNKEEMVAKREIIEVKHYGVTQDGSLKYPEFLRRRLDKE